MASRSVTFDQPSSGIPTACQITPRRADQPHAGFPATESGLEFIMEQISRLPTRWDLTKYAFVILSVGDAGLDQRLSNQLGSTVIFSTISVRTPVSDEPWPRSERLDGRVLFAAVD